MASWAFLLFAFVSASVYSAESKTFTVCGLAKALKKEHVAQDQIATWICIAKIESNYNTAAVNVGDGDYGLFQISKQYWCNEGNHPGKICNVTCNDLLQDNISASVKCAKKIYNETSKQGKNGFSAWAAYNNVCKHEKNLPDISNC